MAKHVVAAVGDIPPGTRKLTQVNGRAIVVFNLGGEFFALNNRCPHRGGSLAHGIQTAVVESKVPGEYLCSRPGEMVKCPWHGWEFDIRSGKSWCDPTRMRIRQYTVTVYCRIRIRVGSHHDLPVRISNSQPCQGHFTISPGREQRYSPGTFDSTTAVWMPCARLPPRCGQRLLSAKKSPARSNTTMLRPATSTSLRWPGGISSTAATT